MVFFRSEDLLVQWCRGRGVAPSPPVRIDQLWRLAVTWYASRLQADSRRPAAAETRGIFESIGLHGDFWDPRMDTFR